MDQGEKAPSVGGNRTEIGVCGTGKHRVINVNPLLLTPLSATKIYAGKRQEQLQRRKRENRHSLGGTVGVISPVQSVFSVQRIPPKNLLASSPMSLPGNTFPAITQHDTPLSRLSTIPSTAGSEVSLSSNVTTDDISSIADSEMTDISELTVFGSYNGVFPLDSQLTSPDLNFEANESEINFSSLDAGDEDKCDDSTEVKKLKLRGEEERKNAELAKIQKTVFASIPRRNRTIEIAPSLMLPVTSVSTSTRKEIERVNTSGNVEEHAANRLDGNTSGIAEDSITLTEDTNPTTKLPAITTNLNFQVDEEKPFVSELKAECKNLQQTLKLAEADIAILVSSKQQLQLKYQELKEEKSSMLKSLAQIEQKYLECNSKWTSAEQRLKEKEQSRVDELEMNKQQMEKLVQQNNALLLDLGAVTIERDSGKNEIENLLHSLETDKIRIQLLEKEMQNMQNSNSKLDTLVAEASLKGEGSRAYINHMKQESKETSMRLQVAQQLNQVNEVKLKKQESKIVDLMETNSNLSAKVSKLEARSQEFDRENMSLTKQLKNTSDSKGELNSAVARLRIDMSKVEISFQRLKNQMIEKSKVAEEETKRREQVEEELKKKSEEIAKLNVVNAEIRIRDKNVQIEQLLTKSRTSSMEKSRIERKVSELQAHIEANEQSWVKAVEQEKRTVKLLEEKEKTCCNLSQKNQVLSSELEAHEEKLTSLTHQFAEINLQQSDSKEKLLLAKQMIASLTTEKESLSGQMMQLLKQLNDEKVTSQIAMQRYEDNRLRLKKETNQLNSEIEVLQGKLLTQEGELRLFEGGSVTSEKEVIHQMELLSELQAARRDLSCENESLQEENRILKSEMEDLSGKINTLNDELVERNREGKSKLHELEKELHSEISSLEERINQKEKRLKEVEASRRHQNEEMLVVKDHNNALSQQLGALQSHKKKLTDDLELKLKELVYSHDQCNRMSEERAFLKQELSSVTLQLSEAMRTNGILKELNSSSATENLIKERDLLKDAVARQQQYAASLQKHYEKWAKETGSKVKEELSKMQVAAEEERHRFEQERLEQAEQIVLMERKMKKVTDDRQFKESILSSRVSAEARSHNSCRDSATQTDHDKEALIPWSQQYDEGLLLKEETEALKHKLNIGNQQNDHEDPATDLENLVMERNLLKETVRRQQHYTTSLQNHYEKWARNAGHNMTEEIQRVRETAEAGMKCLEEENLKQAKLITSQKETLSSYAASHDQQFENAATQTSHLETPLNVFSNQKQSSFGKEIVEASTQTSHSDEKIVPWDQKADQKLKDEIAEVRVIAGEEIARITQENMNLIKDVDSLKEELNALKLDRNCEVASVGIQTSHEETTLVMISDQPGICSNDSTQTDHDLNSVISMSQNVAELKEEITRLRMNAEEEKLNHDSSKFIESVELRQTNDGFSQTDHNSEIIMPWSQIVDGKMQNDISLEVITPTDQERDQFLLKKKEWEKRIINLQTRMQDCEMVGASTQTSHTDTPLQILSNSMVLQQESMLLENNSTQTEHNGDPVAYSAKESHLKEQISVLKREVEAERFKSRCQDEQIMTLKEHINELMSPLKQKDTGSQTIHDEESLPSVPNPKSILQIEHSTQTDHNDEPIVPWSQEVGSKMKYEIEQMRLLAEEDKRENMNKSKLIASSEAKLENFNCAKCVLMEDYTQTSHDEISLPVSIECNLDKEHRYCNQMDSGTQTNHDLQTVQSFTEVCQECSRVQELDFSKKKLSSENTTLTQFPESNKRFSATIEVTANRKNMLETGTQTSHDAVPLSWNREVKNALQKIDASSQTDHNLMPVSHTWMADIPTNDASVQTENKHLEERTPCENLSHTKHEKIQNDISKQNSITTNSEEVSEYDTSHDSLDTINAGKCSMCGRSSTNVTDLEPPSPMTILRTMESRKLRAYKKTVHLLKKKLQNAEDHIGDLEAEIVMLSSSIAQSQHIDVAEDVVTNQMGSGDDSLSSQKRDLMEHNTRAMNEIKLLRDEIFEIKKSSALHTEDMKRRTLAERKKADWKVANMSEKISTMTETNTRLRNCVEKLQVKLSENTKSLDVAQKEKQRYQLRARKLQASLRSLAWITGKQEDSALTGGDVQIADFQLLEDSTFEQETSLLQKDSLENSKCEIKSICDRSILSLPTSVLEIEDSLKDLQNEIVTLERQMQEHNNAVKSSKSRWKKLKQESNLELVVEPDEGAVTPEKTRTLDRIDQITHVV